MFSYHGGRAFYGVATGSGSDYVAKALDQLIHCPLLHLNQYPHEADQLILHIQAGQDLPLAAVNKLVMTLGDHFGVSQEIMVSAIFDENLNETLRMCILGKRGIQLEKKDTFVPEASVKNNPMSVTAAIAADLSSEGAVHKSKLKSTERAFEQQDEFQFIDKDADRGYFVKTDHNEYGGEDLDVPTFMRKGLKLNVRRST